MSCQGSFWFRVAHGEATINNATTVALNSGLQGRYIFLTFLKTISHAMPMLGRNPITNMKLGKCPDMTITADWDVKQQLKQTNNNSFATQGAMS